MDLKFIEWEIYRSVLSDWVFGLSPSSGYSKEHDVSETGSFHHQMGVIYPVSSVRRNYPQRCCVFVLIPSNLESYIPSEPFRIYSKYIRFCNLFMTIIFYSIHLNYMISDILKVLQLCNVYNFSIHTCIHKYFHIEFVFDVKYQTALLLPLRNAKKV
jgi:hypothetical protein